MTHAHVLTGSFGAGKTTAIRRLMAAKPAAEMWVVILNEFTDMGLDALNVAQSARGSYDVRLVAGGCLCCVGELDFGKQLRDILRNLRPVRLLIEPSGAGHAADIVDELAIYEAQRALTLDSIICLVDALDAQRILASRNPTEWSQIQSADVLLLSKPDLAGPPERAAFDEIAAAQFPAKRFLGECLQGELPPDATHQYSRQATFSALASRAPASSAASTAFEIGGLTGQETRSTQLGLHAVAWLLPRELTFSRVLIEPRLTWILDSHQGYLRRLKGVFRTGPGPSWQIQSQGRGLQQEDSAYRRDSRLEVLFNAPPAAEFLEQWRALLRDAALPMRR
jgi:G3E family GTPase